MAGAYWSAIIPTNIPNLLPYFDQGLTYGRPTSFAMSFVDCQIPEEPTKNAQGEYEMSCASQIVFLIVALT